MRTLQRFLVTMVPVVMLASATACSPAAGPQLTGRTFLSVAVTDAGAARSLVANTRIRLVFGPRDVNASAGCNSIGGTWRIDGGRLLMEGAGMTEMGCDPDRMAQDAWLIAFMGSKPAVRLSGDELLLDAGTTIVRLLDRKVVEPDVALTGHPWTVVSVISGGTAASVPQGANATLTFAGDGSLTVNDGCNQGNATWKAIAGGIDVSGLVLTKRACDGAGAALESAVVGVLRAGSIAASIEADLLTLQASGSGLQLRAS